MSFNYSTLTYVYKKVYLYGVLPFAVVSSAYCAVIAHTMPIFSEVELTSYMRFKFGLSAFAFVAGTGIVWPVSLPLALISSSLQ